MRRNRWSSVSVVLLSAAWASCRTSPSAPPQGATERRAQALAAAAASAGSWFPLGPTPLGDGPTYAGLTVTVPSAGRATVIASNPVKPSEVWLGTATGGVWHTFNAQLTDPEWVPIDGLQFPDFVTEGPPGAIALPIGSITLDGCASTGGCARVWIGTGEDGIRRDTFYGSGLYLQTPDIAPGIDPLGLIREFRGASIVSIALPPHATGTTDTVYIAVSSGVTAPGTEETVTAPGPDSGYGIFATTDASSFAKLPIPGVGRSLPTDIQFDPADTTGKTLLVGFMAADRTDTSAARGILRGTNGGFNASDWCSVNDNSVAGIPRCANSSGLPAGNSVVASPPLQGQDEIVGYATIRFSPSVANRVYARIGLCGQRTDIGCPSTSIFVSQNRGLAWTPVAINTPTSLAGNTRFFDRYTHVLTVVPGGTASAEQIIIGGTVLMSCSGQGGGCTAVGSSLSQTHPDHHDFVIPGSAAPGVMYSANDGGFFFSTDSGNNWIAGNTTLTTSQFDSLAVYDQQVFGGLQDQGVGYFTGTRVWSNRSIGDGGAVVVYAAGSPAQTVWIYGGAEATPNRSLNDPTSNIVNLGSFMPASARAQASGSTGLAPFFPPIALNRVTHDIYFGTIQVYMSTDTDDVRGDTWATISPILPTQQGHAFSDIETDNVITALGIGDDGAVYAGTYTGELWVSTSPCQTASCWNKVAGPGTSAPIPHLPISSIAVKSGDSATAFVSLSGFGTTNHVWQTTTRGTSWTATSTGLVDAPANVLHIDTLGIPRLGTDIGIYAFDGATWTRDIGLPFVPVTAVTSWSTGAGTQRLYAGTHGRGAWVLAQPTVVTLEGWANNAIWDVPVYGYGFTNTTGAPVACTISLVQQSGAICATGGFDVSRNDFGQGGTIEVDTNGQLQTTQPAPASTWDNKPVVWACNQGHCINGTAIASCNQDAVGNQDFITDVLVDCGVAGKGAAHILGAPTLGNPPSTSLLFDPPADAPRMAAAAPAAPAALAAAAAAPATWSFDAVVSLTTKTGASLVCRATVTVNQGAPDEQVVQATVAALNASPQCQGAGITATADIFHPVQGEDPAFFPPEVRLQTKAGAMSGSQLFVTFASTPGSATGLCFMLAGLGNATLHQTAILQTIVQTAASGASGGAIRFREGTDIGVCKRDVATTAGMTAAQVAAAIGKAFTSVSAPGPADCIARNNPLDVEVGHLGENPATLYTVISHQLQVCSFDPGIGFVSTPDGVDVPVSAQACVVGTNSLRIAERVTTSGGIATDSLDMEPGATANGGANINNVNGGQVRISGATINGTVDIAGAAPSTANGELLNGGKIVGPVITGAGLQATLPTQTVTPGTTSITVNAGAPARTIAPGSYAAIVINGSTVTFRAGTYNLASLTINAGATVRFDTSGGPIAINVQGTITINGGVLSAGNSAEVTFYSNSGAPNAVAINAGIATFPGSVSAPKGSITVGSRISVQGCVRGQNVDIEPDTSVAGTSSATGCSDGQREGFVNLNSYPRIAGCSGGWSIAGVMSTNPGKAPACPALATHNTVTPACNRMGGDDGLNPNGTGCAVADLCASGWHVCTTAADVASHSPTGCTGATTSTDPRLFFVSRQSSNGCGDCATGTRTGSDCNSSACTTGCAQTAVTSNDIFGCGNLGATSPLVGCGLLSETSKNFCAALAGTSWSCDDGGSGLCEAYAVVHSSADFGGALCCKD